MMKNSLLERFELPYHDPASEKTTYIIGVDFGDGEYAATRVFLHKAEMKMDKMKVSNGRDYTEFAVYAQVWKNGKMLEEGVGKSFVTQDAVGDHSYAGFKRRPGKGPGTSGEMYNAGRKKVLTGYTYGYLMSQAFSCLVHTILKENEVLDNPKQKQVYIFVGRPSSAQWEASERNYAEMLAENLKSYPNLSFHVAVVSEAKAAMASEYFAQRRKTADGIEPEVDIQKETIAIIDGGSSTFDCVVVRDGHVVCEYSRQIGAGKLDKNFLSIQLFSDETVRSSAERLEPALLDRISPEEADKPVTEAAAATRDDLCAAAFAQRNDKGVLRLAGGMGSNLVSLREAKENYFGPNGNDGNSTVPYSMYYDSQSGEEEGLPLLLRFPYKLKQAVWQMPVMVEASYSSPEPYGGHQNMEYPSFAAALEAFYRGARAKWEESGIEKPDRVIVTGGATLMPFVNDIMARVFEVEKQGIEVSQPTGNRHFSVSQGVAYIGFVELYKEKIYREVCEKCDSLVQEMRFELGQALLQAATDYLWMDCLNWVDTWKKSSDCKSFSDLNQLKHDPPKSPWTWNECVYREIFKCIEQNLLKKIQGYLKENTGKMFPNAKEFRFDLDVSDLASVKCNHPSLSFSNKLFRGGGFIEQTVQVFSGFSFVSQNKKIDSAAKAKVAQNVRNNKSEFCQSIQKQLPSLNGQVDTAVDTITRKLHTQMESYVAQMDDFFIREDFKQG